MSSSLNPTSNSLPVGTTKDFGEPKATTDSRSFVPCENFSTRFPVLFEHCLGIRDRNHLTDIDCLMFRLCGYGPDLLSSLKSKQTFHKVIREREEELSSELPIGPPQKKPRISEGSLAIENIEGDIATLEAMANDEAEHNYSEVAESAKDLHPDFRERLKGYCSETGNFATVSREGILQVLTELYVEKFIYAICAQDSSAGKEALEKFHVEDRNALVSLTKQHSSHFKLDVALMFRQYIQAKRISKAGGEY